MTVSRSLLAQIPLPKQEMKPTTPVASIKVGDVEADKSCVENNTSNNWLDRLKNKIIEYRMKKIAQKSPEERTPNEQAEYEANQKSMNCVI